MSVRFSNKLPFYDGSTFPLLDTVISLQHLIKSLEKNVADHEQALGHLADRVNNLNLYIAKQKDHLKFDQDFDWRFVDAWYEDFKRERLRAFEEADAIEKVKSFGYTVVKVTEQPKDASAYAQD